MSHFKRSVGCITVLFFSTMFMDDVLAGSLIGGGQVDFFTQHTSNEQHLTDNEDVEASAGPMSTPVQILQIRPYISHGANPGVIFIKVDQSSLCNTATYSIDMGSGGGREAYAAALTAFLVEKPVIIELVSSGCSGAGTKIQSIVLSR